MHPAHNCHDLVATDICVFRGQRPHSGSVFSRVLCEQERAAGAMSGDAAGSLAEKRADGMRAKRRILPVLMRVLGSLLCCLPGGPAQASGSSQEMADVASLERLFDEREKSGEYGAFIADLLIQMLLKEQQKHLLFVPPALYATRSAPQGALGRQLVAKYSSEWQDALEALVGMLNRRGWLVEALSPRGVRIPLSMEIDNRTTPLIGYIAPLLNQRDLSECEVERKQAARCHAAVWLRRVEPEAYSIVDMKIVDGAGEEIQLRQLRSGEGDGDEEVGDEEGLDAEQRN